MADKPSDNSGVIVEEEANLDAPPPEEPSREASAPAEPPFENPPPTDAIPEDTPLQDSSLENPPSVDPSPAAPENVEAPLVDEFDDIAAELARIERMTLEEAEAIPSLDDGNDDEPADVASATRAPSDSNEFNAQDDELAAALAEVEQISVKPKTAAEKSEDAARPTEEKAVAKTNTPAKPPQFKIGKKEETKESSESIAAVQPKSAVGPWLYNLIHEWLDRINRPFGEMSDATRKYLGLIALTTIVVSLLVIYLMPIVYPNYDAIQFVRERRAALDQPPPLEEEPGADAEKNPQRYVKFNRAR